MLKVYGAGDDNIEVEGDINEELYAIRLWGDNEDEAYLAFSDGTVLRVTAYSRTGVWRFQPVVVGDLLAVIDPAPEDDDDDYSDVVHFEAGVAWVVMGPGFAK